MAEVKALNCRTAVSPDLANLIAATTAFSVVIFYSILVQIYAFHDVLGEAVLAETSSDTMI